jgi:hypothetical protein
MNPFDMIDQWRGSEGMVARLSYHTTVTRVCPIDYAGK